jgi:CO/xanthine dehydrogenase FAD-binding subunit
LAWPAVLRIGALTTYTELIASALVGSACRCRLRARVGGAQIQNRGTLGGNVANASPAGDTLPVLAAANARLVRKAPPAVNEPWPSTTITPAIARGRSRRS